MSWLTSVGTFHTLSSHYIPEYQYRVFGGWIDTYVRKRHIQVSEFRGVTQAAADSYANAHSTDTNTTVKSERMNDANAHRVILSIDSASAWVLIPHDT